jgi:hypothetical protein
MSDNLDPRAALWNRFAAFGGRYTKDEEEAWLADRDVVEGVDDDIPGVGAIDINPMNYLASAATGAFGGVLQKADEDLEEVQQSIRKKKKKRKVEAEPEPVPAPAPPPVRRIQADRRVIRALRRPWYKEPWVPFAAAGVAAVTAIGVMVRR